ncbi:MAG TPA: hypothetical protein VLD19_19575, partial [Chitinophagaceae bacterium]|nr:hypothetical protein [Chitinophagaceae bacterium]
MKKILIAVDANKFNPGLPDFACYLARLTRSNPTAVFLDKPVAEEIPVLKRALGSSYVETVLASDIPGVREKKELQVKNAQLYKEIFDNNGLGCLQQQVHGAPLTELIAESRFADALVVDPQTSFEEKTDEVPTRFVKEVLSKSECPVIIAPFSFYGIDEIVFAYDGSCSSMFAMKQFVQLFPDFRNTKVTVLQVAEKESIPQGDKEKVL